MKALKQAILKHYKYHNSHWGIAIDGMHIRGIKGTVTASYFKSGETITMTQKEVEAIRKQGEQLTTL